jgi:hypothetical protein
MSITIRQARPTDANAIYDMIYELAVYEKAPEEVVTTPDEIKATLFGADSKTEALICEIDGNVAGYAVFFTSYSTWLGRNGIYMEDLYFPGLSRRRGRQSLTEIHCAMRGTAQMWSSGMERARLEQTSN